MTVTYVGLVGAWESFADTMRAFVYSKWTSANTLNLTPRMKSPGGEKNDTPGQNYPKSNRVWPNNFNEDGIYFNTQGAIKRYPTQDQSQGFGAVRMQGCVYIDIFAQTEEKSTLFALEFNRIILQNQPNSATGTRIPKSDGSASAIMTFEESMVDFTNPERIIKIPLMSTIQLAGQLHCNLDVLLT